MAWEQQEKNNMNEWQNVIMDTGGGNGWMNGLKDLRGNVNISDENGV